jgi:hypothetical protein
MYKNDLLIMLEMLDKNLFKAIEELNQYVILEGGTGKKITRPTIEDIREVSRILNNLKLAISDFGPDTSLEHININIQTMLDAILNEPHEKYKD